MQQNEKRRRQELLDTIAAIGDLDFSRRYYPSPGAAHDLIESIGLRLNVLADRLECACRERERDLKLAQTERDELRAVFNGVREALFFFGQDGKIEIANSFASTLLGYPPDKLVGMKVERIIELVPNDANGGVVAGLPVDLRERAVGRLCFSGLADGVRRNIRTAEGLSVPALLSGAALRDKRGELLGVASVVRDMRQNLALEEALRERDERFRHVFEDTAVGMALVGIDGHIIQINAALSKLLGVPSEQAVGATLTSFIHSDDHGLVRRTWHQAESRTASNLQSIELRIGDETTSSDSLRYGSASWSMLRHTSDSIGMWVVQIEDITDKIRAEREREEMQVKLMAGSRLATLGEMAASMAHEINQPLTYVSTFVQNLSRHCIDGEQPQPEWLEKRSFAAIEALSRIEEIIRHLRVFARLEDNDGAAGQKDQLFELHVVLNQALLFVRERFRLADVAIRISIDDDTPQVSGAGTQIEQVLLNLLQNALDAHQAANNSNDSKWVEIAISRTSVPDPNNTHQRTSMAVVRVSDNGPGVSPDLAESVFEPFVTTKAPGEGTGLGLAISYGIIRDHGGTIRCEPLRGAGASFIVSLPGATSDE